MQANSADATIALLDEPFSVIIITIIMPKVPGLEMLKEIHSRGIKAPVIIVSAAFYKKGEEEVKARTGVFGCISQVDFEIERFKGMLDAAIRSQN